jgi:hypothetical protein
MFDQPVVVSGEDVESCADGLVDSVREIRLSAARRLARVAAWADVHSPAPGAAGFVPGGEGTPAVTLFTATELGCLVQTTTTSARSLLADALDLRHRHPRLWAAVMTGQVEDFKARHVARLTRAAGLSLTQALQVDLKCVDAVVGVSWGRAMSVVEAAILRADPGGRERRQAEASQARYVTAGRPDAATGLGTMITRTLLGDLARFDAMVGRIAQALGERGDTDELQVRRAKAFAVLADPARACLLLATDATRADANATIAGADAIDAASELGQLLLAQGATALARLRPRTVIYAHLTAEALRSGAGVARVEGVGPVELSALRELIGNDAVVLTPVVDHQGQVPVDAYEVPARMREAMNVRHPFEVFPWGTLRSRAADLDHTIAYRPPDDGGPPGQTRPGNLGPLARGHHNAKTHGGFRLYQPTPGTYLWRTPSGHWYQVDHQGTTPLGRALPAPVQRTDVEVLHSPLEVQLAGLLAG